MTPPQSNIFRDHPRKFTLAGVVILICGIATMQIPGVIIGAGLAVGSARLWLDDARYQAGKRQEWDRFHQETDRAVEELEQRYPDRVRRYREATARAEESQRCAFAAAGKKPIWG